MFTSILSNKLFINTLIQSFGKLISAGIGFLTVFYLTRYLGVDGYGKFTLVFAYLTIFSTLGDFGLHLSMIKELAHLKIKRDKLIGTYFTLRFILLIASTLIAFFCLFFVPYSLELKIAILIASIGVNIGLMSGFGNAIFQSELKIGLITIFDLVAKILTVVFIIFFISIKLNFNFIVSTILIGNLFALIFSIFFLKKYNNFFISFEKNIAFDLLKISIPVGITSFFSLLYFKIDTILISLLRDTSEIAYYGVSYKLFENILIIWGFYMASAYPILSSKINDIKEFNLFLKKNIKTAIYGSIIIIIFFYILTPILIKYLAGENFSPSILSLRILLFSIPFFFINNIIYHVFILKNKSWILVRIFILSLIINILLNIFAISNYGFIGASIITLVTEIFISIVYLYIYIYR